MTKTHVEFVVSGFEGDPVEITRLVGIAPTAAWKRGDPTPARPAVLRTQSRWILASPSERSEEVDVQISRLLDELERSAVGVRSAVDRFGAGILVAMYAEEVNPGASLDADSIRRLAALGLRIDFDIYCLGSDEAE